MARDPGGETDRSEERRPDFVVEAAPISIMMEIHYICIFLVCGEEMGVYGTLEPAVPQLLFNLHHDLTLLARVPSPNKLPVTEQLRGVLLLLETMSSSPGNNGYPLIQNVASSISWVLYELQLWLESNEPGRRLLFNFAIRNLHPYSPIVLQKAAFLICGHLDHELDDIPLDKIPEILSSCLTILRTAPRTGKGRSNRAKPTLSIFESDNISEFRRFFPSVNSDHYRFVERFASLAERSSDPAAIPRLSELLQLLIAKARVNDSHYRALVLLAERAMKLTISKE